MINIAQK